MGVAERLSGKLHPGVNSGTIKAGGGEATVIYIISVCVSAHTQGQIRATACMYACGGQRTTFITWFLVLSFTMYVWGLESGFWAWWQAPVSTRPSRWPLWSDILFELQVLEPTLVSTQLSTQTDGVQGSDTGTSGKGGF